MPRVSCGTFARREAAGGEGSGKDRRGRAGFPGASRLTTHQCVATPRSEYGAAPTIAAMIVNTSW